MVTVAGRGPQLCWLASLMSKRPSRRLTPRQLLVDITPLRQSVPFRWLFGGLSLSWMGRQLTVVAVPFQVFQLTGSTFLVGALGVAQLIPLLLTSVVGGALVDSVDRRRLLVLAQVASMGTAIGLAINASLDEPSVWLIFALSAINAGFSAIDSPARAASLPTLVGRHLLPASLAITQTVANVAKTLGPAIGGLLIAQTSLAATYSLEALAFFISAVLMFGVGELKPEGGGQRFGWESIKEGFRFLKERRILQANFIIDLNAMVFGMPQALFPVIGTEVLGGDASTVGLLYAAPGAGALLGAMTSGWVGLVRRHGRGVVIAVIVWGAAIAAFGLATSVWLALALLALAGAADVISAVFRTTILQLAVPDRLRGRLSSIQIAVVAGGPRLGDFEAGAVASVTSPQFSVVSGGLACILGALFIARKVPEYDAYEALADHDP
ncbi:MAG TPA: MFS transporter [Acidimicrobiia bacterium]|nr:MFS transporter [Acidimicrobiia bacterium]